MSVGPAVQKIRMTDVNRTGGTKDEDDRCQSVQRMRMTDVAG